MGVLLYHGTAKENVATIMKTGFRKGTYFTPYFDSAMAMGGDHVFGVYFKEEPTKYWEYISRRRITPSRIASVRKLKVRLLYYNPQILKQLKRDEGHKLCRKCGGHGELTYNDDGHHLLPGGCSWKTKRKVVGCPKCKGTGIK